MKVDFFLPEDAAFARRQLDRRRAVLFEPPGIQLELNFLYAFRCIARLRLVHDWRIVTPEGAQASAFSKAHLALTSAENG